MLTTPSRRLSNGCFNPTAALSAATTFSCSDGKLSLGARRKRYQECATNLRHGRGVLRLWMRHRRCLARYCCRAHTIFWAAAPSQRVARCQLVFADSRVLSVIKTKFALGLFGYMPGPSRATSDAEVMVSLRFSPLCYVRPRWSVIGPSIHGPWY